MYNKEKKCGCGSVQFDYGGRCLSCKTKDVTPKEDNPFYRVEECSKGVPTPNKHEDVDERWKKAFDKEFLHCEACGVFRGFVTPFIVKSFIHTLLDEKDSERKEALKIQAESILGKMLGEREHSNHCYFLQDGSYLKRHCDCGAIIFNDCLSECKEIIKGYIK